MSKPDNVRASVICDRHLRLNFTLEEEAKGTGRGLHTLAVGTCMFFGVFMAAMPFENRREFCRAALGFSLRADEKIKKHMNKLTRELKARKS
jgi:hypothetical protein